jgi:hypothetical protein
MAGKITVNEYEAIPKPKKLMKKRRPTFFQP